MEGRSREPPKRTAADLIEEFRFIRKEWERNAQIRSRLGGATYCEVEAGRWPAWEREERERNFRNRRR